MNFFALLIALTATLGANDLDWKSLDGCVQRLKSYESELNGSILLRTFVALDRRLNFMLEGVRYSEYNLNRLKIVLEKPPDNLAPYLVSNSTAACEAYEARLTSYLGGFKRFLVLFFITSLSVSFYGAYVFTLLTTKTEKPRERKAA